MARCGGLRPRSHDGGVPIAHCTAECASTMPKLWPGTSSAKKNRPNTHERPGTGHTTCSPGAEKVTVAPKGERLARPSSSVLATTMGSLGVTGIPPRRRGGRTRHRPNNAGDPPPCRAPAATGGSPALAATRHTCELVAGRWVVPSVARLNGELDGCSRDHNRGLRRRVRDRVGDARQRRGRVRASNMWRVGDAPLTPPSPDSGPNGSDSIVGIGLLVGCDGLLKRLVARWMRSAAQELTHGCACGRTHPLRSCGGPRRPSGRSPVSTRCWRCGSRSLGGRGGHLAPATA